MASFVKLLLDQVQQQANDEKDEAANPPRASDDRWVRHSIAREWTRGTKRRGLRHCVQHIEQVPPAPLCPPVSASSQVDFSLRVLLRGRNARSKPLISRICARMALRVLYVFAGPNPMLEIALWSPCGPPDPLAPPCIRHRARPVTAACSGGTGSRSRPTRRALARFESRRSMSA